MRSGTISPRCNDLIAVGCILICGNEGAMPREAVMRSIELLGTKVIPAVKDDRSR